MAYYDYPIISAEGTIHTRKITIPMIIILVMMIQFCGRSPDGCMQHVLSLVLCLLQWTVPFCVTYLCDSLLSGDGRIWSRKLKPHPSIPHWIFSITLVRATVFELFLEMFYSIVKIYCGGHYCVYAMPNPLCNWVTVQIFSNIDFVQ